MSLFYNNTLRVDGSNVCITKMRPMPSLTTKPYHCLHPIASSSCCINVCPTIASIVYVIFCFDNYTGCKHYTKCYLLLLPYLFIDVSF